MLQKWAIANFSDFHHEIWADDQAPVCNMYVTLLHVIIWDNQYNILCVATMSADITLPFFPVVPLRPFLSMWQNPFEYHRTYYYSVFCVPSYAMLCCDMCMLYLSLDMHMLHSGNCLRVMKLPGEDVKM